MNIHQEIRPAHWIVERRTVSSPLSSSPPPPRPACTICYSPSPLLSLFYAGGRPRHSDTSAHYRRESAARQAGTQAGGRTDGGLWSDVPVFVGTRRTGWWICLFYGFGSGSRITSHGTKPAFFHVIRRFVSPGVLTPEETEAAGGARLTDGRHEYTRVPDQHPYTIDANKTACGCKCESRILGCCNVARCKRIRGKDALLHA